MKNSIILLFFFGMITVTSAQFDFGVKAGFNLSKATQGKPSDESPIAIAPMLAYHFGISSEYTFTDNLAVAGDFLYSVKGERLVPNKNTDRFDIVEPFSTRFEYHYIAVPLSLKYKIGNFGISGGAEFSYLLNTFVAENDLGYTAVDDFFFDGFDLGILGGIDYRFDKLAIGLRFIRGLKDESGLLFTDENGVPLTGISTFHETLQLSAAYFFL